MEKITQTLCTAMNSDSFVRVIFADRRKKSTEYRKVTLRPVSIKGEYMYQAEYHYDKKPTGTYHILRVFPSRRSL